MKDTKARIGRNTSGRSGSFWEQVDKTIVRVNGWPAWKLAGFHQTDSITKVSINPKAVPERPRATVKHGRHRK